MNYFNTQLSEALESDPNLILPDNDEYGEDNTPAQNLELIANFLNGNGIHPSIGADGSIRLIDESGNDFTDEVLNHPDIEGIDRGSYGGFQIGSVYEHGDVGGGEGYPAHAGGPMCINYMRRPARWRNWSIG